MKSFKFRRLATVVGLSAIVAMLSACATKEAPPPKVALPIVVVPPEPRPPLGAPATLPVPARDVNGVRHTINSDITPAQITWNFRSAYNVAALNCTQPEHAAILEGYREFLKANGKGLTTANKNVDSEFKAKHGKPFVKVREAYMTQVYNYFALPPTLPAFCDASLAMVQSAKLVKPADLDGFASASLGKLDEVFRDFFNSYDQYRVDLAAWKAKYTPPTAAATGPTITLPQPAAATAQ